MQLLPFPTEPLKKLFVEEFGVTPDIYFHEFEHRPAASASVAQVHKAKLKDGTTVAVKIQKPEIQKQIGWDLWSFKVLMWTYEKLFDLPAMFAVDYISEHLREECDFTKEAANSIQCAEFVQHEPSLRQKVHIPRVYSKFSTKRVMTAEWIDGVRLSDLDGINKARFSKKEIMQIMVDLFSAQIMKSGFLHCDPHPGNIFIRYMHGNKVQLVLIDHGLYIRENDTFRHQYCLLWKSLFTFDNDQIAEIARGWGIHSPDLFASATLMRPYGGGSTELREALSHEDSYKAQLLIKQKLKDFLKETEKLPLALLFIGRNMRIVQGNNQRLGSPVNRVKITASWASRCLSAEAHLTFVQRLAAWFAHLKFLGTCVLLDITFYTTRLQQVVFRRKDGFEDLIEKSMEKQMKEMGISPNYSVFEG